MDDDELIERFADYQRGRGFSENTIHRRRMSLNRWRKYLAPMPLPAASLVDVEEWLQKLLAPSTRRAYAGDLAAFYRWAHRRNLIDQDPMAHADSVRVPRTLPKPAPPAAIAAAFVAGDGDTQLMVMLGALAGLRCAEIASLSMSDVHLEVDPPVLMVRCGKGAKDRIVPLHPTLVALLRRRPAGYLFPSSRPCGHRTPDAVGRRLAKALTTDGGVRVTGHQLRHYFGTNAARASGGNLLAVGRLMGHESPNTTAGYVAWAADSLSDIVGRISAPGFVADELAKRRSRSA